MIVQSSSEVPPRFELVNGGFAEDYHCTGAQDFETFVDGDTNGGEMPGNEKNARRCPPGVPDAGVTRRHYMAPGVERKAKQRAAMVVLQGGAK